MPQTTPKQEFKDFQLPVIGKRWFYRVAQYPIPPEHIYDIEPHKELLNALTRKGVDLFTFIERSFLGASKGNELGLFSNLETIGLLRMKCFDEWFKSITHRARQLTRKGQRMGLKVGVVDINEDFLRSAFRIYNETPIRQGRKYSGFGLSMTDLRTKFSKMDDSEVIGAYFNNELVGLMWVGYGDRVATVNSFLSLISCRDKYYPNYALLAETVKRSCEKGYKFLTYGNMGYNPGLDFFKKTNGFKIFAAPRYYVPLSAKGQLAIKLKLFQPVEHSFSPTLTRALVPIYNIGNKLLPSHSNDRSDA